jgi:hypothetical protein
MQYRLRTLLIALALGPPVLAGGYWVWSETIPRLRQWYTYGYVFPRNTPGYRWKQARGDRSWREVPLDTPPYGRDPEFAPPP